MHQTIENRLSVNTATVRKQGDLTQIMEACARHGIRAVAPWRDQVAAVGLKRAARAVRENDLALSGYCRGGMFPANSDRRAEVRDDNRLAVDEAVALGAPCLVLVVGGLPQFSRPGSAPTKNLMQAQTQVEDGISELLEYARDAGLPLAIEPLHPMYAADRSCVNTIRHALDLCDRLDAGRTGLLGVAVDVYHVWWDPELEAQIRRAGKERLLAFHVCDWLVPTTDLLEDRGMMGDGAIDIPKIRGWIESEAGIGHIEVEIFSKHWWSRPMDEVLDTCLSRCRSAV